MDLTSIGNQPISRYRQLLITVGIFVVATVTFYLSIYSQYHYRQVLVALVMILLPFILVPLVFWLLKKDYEDLAGGLTLISLVIAYGGNELAWRGLTVYHLVGGLLLLILASRILLPRRYSLLLILGLFYVTYLVWINSFEPFQRVDQVRIPYLLPFTIAANVLLFLTILAQQLVEFQTRTIRARLLITFVILVSIPVAGIGIVSGLLSARNAQDRLFSQLESVAVLKNEEIRTWVENLRSNFMSLLPTPESADLIDALLLQGSQGIDIQSLESYRQILAQYQAIVRETGVYEELYFLDKQGMIFLSTDEGHLGLRESSFAYFQGGLKGIYVNRAELYPYVAKISIIVSAPVVNREGQTVSVIAGRANLNRLYNIMTERAGLGSTGETYLVLYNHRLFTPSILPGFETETSFLFSPGITQAIDLRGNEFKMGAGIYKSYYGDEPVIGTFSWQPDLQVALLAEQSQSEALISTYRVLYLTIGLVVASIVLALLAGLYVTDRIARPLAALSETAGQIAAGNLELAAEVHQLDEIGTLSRAFNSMTAQLRALVTSLEGRVAERTRDLERRSTQLQVAAEVARDAASIREMDDLLNRSVHLIQQRFGYDHVGIFLTDERGEYAQLRAATGESGQKMIAQLHRLRIGETGMVGFVTRTGQPRIAQDVTQDATHYVNPFLPETRSEATLPLKLGTRVIGALDVQSNQPEVFGEDIVSVLQILADQLAIAIESASLLKQTRETLRELETVYGRYTLSSWQVVQQRQTSGYRYRGGSVEPLESPIDLPIETPSNGDGTPESEPERLDSDRYYMLNIPLKLREQVIGSLEFKFEGKPPSPDLVTIYEEIAGRLALLLENARLLQEAQNLAMREQQINQITAQVRSSINLDEILRNTVRELGRAFGASRTFIQVGLSSPEPGGSQTEVTHD